MRRARIYLPLSSADLEALAGLKPSLAPTIGYAVTQRLERAHPGADEEELEYAAFSAAAEASRALHVGPRRLVAAADVDAETLSDAVAPDDVARVRVGAAVALTAVVSLHVDGQPGGDGELQWYDITELSSVQALFR